MSAQFSNPPGVNKPEAYSQLCRVGDTLYLAGQAAQNEHGDVVGVGDIAAQADQVLRNIGAILESQGAGFADLVSIRVYVTDVAFRGAVAAARDRYLVEPLPPSTFLVVKSLAFPELLVEIDAIAHVGGHSTD